jgi:hypothetical protein
MAMLFPVYQPEKSAAQIASAFGKLLNLNNGHPIPPIDPEYSSVATPNTYSRMFTA